MQTTTIDRPSPMLLSLSTRPESASEPTEPVFVNVEDTVLSANKCNCAASDDNPY
jgi:hypothetical protein